MAAQFESLVQPLIIMLALPLSIIGAVLGLLLANKLFDMVAFIGLIMLMGLVTKNSILLVDLTNQYVREGLSVEAAILKTRGSISEGNTIAEPLRACDVFPPMVVQMIAVGEQTGALDEMLAKIADFYDEEVDAAVEQLTAAIEPVMIVLMGVVVGGMLVAMYLPMFKLVTVIGGGAG